jgi:hypothetical protein
MPRSLAELEIRATSHRHDIAPLSATLGDDFLKAIVQGKISPSTTFKLALKGTTCENCAKACRWLAVIRRDYGEVKAREVWDLM